MLLAAIGTQKFHTNIIYDLFDFTCESAKWCHDNVMYWKSEWKQPITITLGFLLDSLILHLASHCF